MEVIELLDDRIPILREKLRTEGIEGWETLSSPNSFVTAADTSVEVLPLNGTSRGVTHVQLTAPDTTGTIIHQVEPERTFVTLASSSDTYVLDTLDDGVTTQQCRCVNDGDGGCKSCCGSNKTCEKGGPDDYYYKYKEICCCCRSNEGYCYWSKTSECCTEGYSC